jgi:predicted ATP-grasp superfamily ATP-dependent carboligase
VSRTVVITDGEQRAALAVVRSLGRAGYRCVVCSSSGRSLAGASRFAAGDRAVPPALAEPAAFASSVIALVRTEAAALVIPISEAAMLALLPEQSALAPAVVPFPDAEAFRRLSDKAELLRVAPEVGLAVPRQVTLRDPTEAARLTGDAIGFPVVLKPSRSVAGGGARRRKLTVRHAASLGELRAEAAAMPGEAYPLLVQQRIIGPGIGIFLLVWNGATIAEFAHRRLREKPPSGGVSVYRESVAADPGLVARSRALLDRFGWRGVAMVEYKLDAATGTPYLMEINGRFWGSLQLAIDAGVDFPALLAAAALGDPIEPARRYRLGVRSRWWWGDVDQLLLRLRRSPAELDLPPGAGGRAGALASFLRLWWPGDRNEILRWSDPRPFVRETLLWLRGR